MKERPIIFSTPMVQAIMAGRKTVTRRLSGLGAINENSHLWEIGGTIAPTFSVDRCWHVLFRNHRTDKVEVIKFPWEKGDILWVRESFCPWEYKGKKYICLKADFGYKTTDPFPSPKWKPSIYMPKRITCRWLRVESVRVERLHRINDNDATLEGIFFDKDSGYWFAGDTCMSSISPLDCYISLWHHLNGPYSWAQNPWVWIINFSVLSPEESQKHLDNARA